MNKQRLASTIWESANNMRSKIDANEYKDFILGFIFYKYLSERQEDYLKKEGLEISQFSDEVILRTVSRSIGYYINEEDLFSTWLKQKADFKISSVSYGINNFNDHIDPSHKHLFNNIFNTLLNNLDKLGPDLKKQSEQARKLIELVSDIPTSSNADYDVLGFIYEYLISMFAASAGKKAGEFYTPHEVSLLMSEIVSYELRGKEKISIYDPTSGSGSLLINIGSKKGKYESDKFKRDKIKITYYAQELNQATYNLTRMNLIMRNIDLTNIKVRNADTLEDDWPFFEDGQDNYSLVRVDAVVSNPPYSQPWNPTDKDIDPRYKEYGVAPKTKADYAFLLHDLYHLDNDGVMAIVLPHGVLFRGGSEYTIRRNLIEKNKIHAVIGLPSNIFFGTGIPTIIMVLKQNKANSDILFIDASKYYEKLKKQSNLRNSDIRRIVDAYISRSDIDKFARLVSLEEIRENDYNLNIPRYVDTSSYETYDLKACVSGGIPNSELDEFNNYFSVLEGLREDLVLRTDGNYSYFDFVNLKEIIHNHPSKQAFIAEYNNAFVGFKEFLIDKFIEDASLDSTDDIKECVIDDFFQRLDKLKLVDKYNFYQTFDTFFSSISDYINLLFTNPNLVNDPNPNEDISNNTDLKDVKRGAIFPYRLVQESYLQEDLAVIKQWESKLEDIDNKLLAIIDSLDEEEKNSNILKNDTEFNFKECSSYLTTNEIEILRFLKVNKKDVTLEDKLKAQSKLHFDLEKNTSAKNVGIFTNKAIDRKIAELMQELLKDEDSLAFKLNKAITLDKEKKETLKEIVSLTTELDRKTADCICNLTEEQARDLEIKLWVEPVLSLFDNMIESIFNDLYHQLLKLHEKYNKTLIDIDEELRLAEADFIKMSKDLVGSDIDLQALEDIAKVFGDE